MPGTSSEQNTETGISSDRYMSSLAPRLQCRVFLKKKDNKQGKIEKIVSLKTIRASKFQNFLGGMPPDPPKAQKLLATSKLIDTHC